MVGKRRKTYHVVCFCILPLQKNFLLLKLDSVLILNFDNKKQKTKFKNQAKIKNDVQNENFRLRMQKTMSDFVFDIQNTKYKIQSTKYKDDDDRRYRPYKT